MYLVCRHAGLCEPSLSVYSKHLDKGPYISPTDVLISPSYVTFVQYTIITSRRERDDETVVY